jgi:hypothetical protein
MTLEKWFNMTATRRESVRTSERPTSAASRLLRGGQEASRRFPRTPALPRTPATAYFLPIGMQSDPWSVYATVASGFSGHKGGALWDFLTAGFRM